MVDEDEIYTRIRITKELRSQLKAIGKKGETYEDIIRAMLDNFKE